MVNLGTLRNVVGFSMKGIGFFWSFADKFLCGTLCKDTCTSAQSNTCSFLLMFVGIIFIVCGFALIVMKDKKRKKLRKKIKNAFNLIKKW